MGSESRKRWDGPGLARFLAQGVKFKADDERVYLFSQRGRRDEGQSDQISHLYGVLYGRKQRILHLWLRAAAAGEFIPSDYRRCCSNNHSGENVVILGVLLYCDGLVFVFASNNLSIFPWVLTDIPPSHLLMNLEGFFPPHFSCPLKKNFLADQKWPEGRRKR